MIERLSPDLQAIREREALARALAAIVDAEGDLDAILSALVSYALEAVPAAEGGVLELIDGEELEYRAVEGTLAPHKGLRVPLRGSLAGGCAASGEAMLVPDALLDPRVARQLAERLGLRAAVLAPVTRAGRTLGVLKLQSALPGAFDHRDLQVARLFAGAATAGLTEVKAAAAEADLRRAQRAGGIGVFSVDVRKDVLHATPEFCRLFGIPARERLSPAEIDRLILPEDAALASSPASRRSGEIAPDAEYRIRRPDTGEVRWLERRSDIERDEAGKPIRFSGVVLDVTARRAALQALTRGEARYRALFEAIDDGFCIIEFFDGPHGPDSDYVHVEANPGYQRHTGIADIVGKTLRGIAPDEADEWAALYGGVLRTGRPIRFERAFLAAGRHIEVSAARIEPPSLRQVSVLFRDVTARREAETALRALTETLETRIAERTAELMRAEEQLRQARKMEAVGQLTGGLAHDFNNLLTGISGGLELLETRIAQGRLDKLGRYVSMAQDAARRAAALTHRLLAFSRRQTLDPRPTDINRLARGMEDLIRRTVGPAIAIEVAEGVGLWPTLVDPPQLENALLNLCINARDAMTRGGRLRIEMANRQLDARDAAACDLRPGDYVTLCVTDTGAGMTPEVAAKAFDPFFTTKPLGQGTGLGLSMIYGFARQSGGHAGIDSEPGRGTTVCLWLPRHAGEAEGEELAPEAADPHPALPGETVLLVDDEPAIRLLASEALEELGYAVIEAADGAAGLRVVRSGARVDLVVTDVGLPGGMNGRQMADAAWAARPDLKVLFITGYAEAAVFGEGRLGPGVHVMTKPFAMEAFTRRVRELIGER